MRNRKTVTILSLLLLLGGNAFVGTAQAAPIGPLVTINFDNLSSPGQRYIVAVPPPGTVPYPEGTVVTPNAQLTAVVTQIPTAAGSVDSIVRFRSVDLTSGNIVQTHVGLVNLEPTPADVPHAPSPPNGIGSVSVDNRLAYRNPIRVDFNGQTTDYFSITPDLRPIPAGGIVTLQAFDIAGNLIASSSGPDNGSGTPFIIQTPTANIFDVQFSSTSTSAFDNLVYDAVVPEPASLTLGSTSALAGLGSWWFRRRRRAVT